jgi:hypothetical protein
MIVGQEFSTVMRLLCGCCANVDAAKDNGFVVFAKGQELLLGRDAGPSGTRPL